MKLNVSQEKHRAQPHVDELSSMSQKETSESAPEPISDQLPKNISASAIFSIIAPDPRGSRTLKER